MPVEASGGSSRFVVRPFQPGDDEAILELFARSFHLPRSREHFVWKYLADPFGSRHISVTFDDAGRLVGHYAGYVVPFYERGRTLLAHQIGDTMTDPAVRHVGRGPTGILGRTALHFYSTFCEGGAVAFNYGFNVSNIQKFSLRFLRSDRVEPVSYRTRDLITVPFPSESPMQRRARGYRMEVVEKVDESWDAFFDRVAPRYAFLTRRDSRYVRWRYLEHPDVRYLILAVRKWGVLAGWSVFRLRNERLAWGDALFDPRWPEAVEVLLQAVTSRLPAAAIDAWFPARPEWWDGIVRDLRFQSMPEPQDLSLMCVPFAEPGATGRMREALYYTMGDSDLF